MAPLTAREVYHHILDTSTQSAMVTGIELLLLEEPILKLRAHLGVLAFVDVFFNAETGKTSFALIKDTHRIFGADNTRAPNNHQPCTAMSYESFLEQVETNKARWAQH